MIELSESTVLILDPEGRSAPFDPDLLRPRLAEALQVSGTPDSFLASDIALAVDFALRERARTSPDVLRSADVELLTGRILSDLGLESAARALYTENSPGAFRAVRTRSLPSRAQKRT